MDLTSGSVFTLNERDYVILEDTNKNDKHYLFLNRLQNDEPTKEYFCAEEENGEVIFLTDDNLVNELLNDFQKKLLSRNED